MATPTVYIGKCAGIRISAEQNSRRVTIDVDGKSAELTAVNARDVVLKLRNALRVAETR